MLILVFVSMLWGDNMLSQLDVKNVSVPVSIGELLDKISILEIKNKKISDPNRLKNIEKEKDALISICKENNIALGDQFNRLTQINEGLWDILQFQRDKEKKKEFDDEFVRLSSLVYHKNDQRFEIKKEINELYDSDIKEEKHYS